MSMHVNAKAALALLKSPRPDINELEDIVGDIPRDDRRASEVNRRVCSLLKEGAFLAAARCLGSRFLLTDRQSTTVSFEGDARLPQLMLWTAPPPARECHGCGRC
jgi:hypothetical protein